MAIRVTAVKSISYGGKRYRPGTHFEAKPAHAKVLAALGKVSLDDDKTTKVRQKPAPKVVEPPKVTTPPKKEESTVKKEEKPVEVVKKEKEVAKLKEEERQGELKSQMVRRRDLTPEEPK